jgi:hypothetical protein
MTHCSDDDLVLHYYGEETADAPHLAACAECATRYRELEAVLQTVYSLDAPPRSDQYGLEVWMRIRHQLPEREPRWRAWWSQWPAATLAGAALLLIVAGFAAGRLWSDVPSSSVSAPVATGSNAAEDRSARRVLLLTVADHFERSERMLTDVMNASAGADISTEQQWADDLLRASRLYRQDAIDADEMSVASVLDELERTLLEIVHRPATVTAADLNEMRRRIDSVALLFKVRVLSEELHQRELEAPLTDAPSISRTTTIG